MQKTSNKAITMISLVVTIVVLMILAGITIAAVTSDNGIINQTKEAKGALELEEIRENIGLAYLKAEAGKHRRNEDLSSKIKNELDKTYPPEEVEVSQDSDGKSYTVKVKGIAFTIDKNGNIGLKSGSKHILIINPNQSSSGLTATLEEGLTGDITWESSNPSVISAFGDTFRRYKKIKDVKQEQKCSCFCRIM